jgi:hypothetical protein
VLKIHNGNSLVVYAAYPLDRCANLAVIGIHELPERARLKSLHRVNPPAVGYLKKIAELATWTTKEPEPMCPQVTGLR